MNNHRSNKVNTFDASASVVSKGPKPVKLYHIVHINRLPSIVRDGFLFSDATISNKPAEGEIIGMGKIKRRRLGLSIVSHPGLHVGECVPFYFCPRSVMLYTLHKGNHPEIEYRGGQEPIIHLVCDLHNSVDWADKNTLRWAFTDSNAGSYYFEDFSDLRDLDKIDWQAVQADQWTAAREKKQAEFLIEQRFPWELVEEIGVYSHQQLQALNEIAQNHPIVRVRRNWYY